MRDEIHGFCDPRFASLKDAFVGNFEAGLELGASLAVTYQGRMVVDLWGGWADLEKTRPWQEDTICPVASTTKVMTTLAGLMMVDRGLIELDAPVARYPAVFTIAPHGWRLVDDRRQQRWGECPFRVGSCRRCVDAESALLDHDDFGLNQSKS